MRGQLEPWQFTFSHKCWLLLLLLPSYGFQITFHVESVPTLCPLTYVSVLGCCLLEPRTSQVLQMPSLLFVVSPKFLRRNLVSYTAVYCLSLISARSVPTAMLDCRNMQQKDIGLPSPRQTVSFLALAPGPFLSVPLLSSFLFLFPGCP